MTFRITFFSFVASITALACSGGEGASATAAGDTSVPTASCKDRCATRATACGATASQGTSICGGYCGKSLTETQMDCLENETCSTLSSSKSACLSTTAPSGKNPTTTKGPAAPANFGNDCDCPNVGGLTISCTDSKNCGSLMCASGAKCSIECKSSSECPSGFSCIPVTMGSTTTKWCL